VTEAAVTQVPDVGAILYNPGHMLLIHLPEIGALAQTYASQPWKILPPYSSGRKRQTR
jgi:hypothetical protein